MRRRRPNPVKPQAASFILVSKDQLRSTILFRAPSPGYTAGGAEPKRAILTGADLTDIVSLRANGVRIGRCF